jgi:ABC-2 type transport system ATP-binding protein
MYGGKLRILDTPRNLKDSIPGGDVIDVRVAAPIDARTIAELKDVVGVVDLATVKPTHLRIYLNRAEKMLPKIMGRLNELGVVVTSVNMKEPSLDDVFLHYTGAELEESKVSD